MFILEKINATFAWWFVIVHGKRSLSSCFIKITIRNRSIAFTIYYTAQRADNYIILIRELLVKCIGSIQTFIFIQYIHLHRPSIRTGRNNTINLCTGRANNLRFLTTDNHSYQWGISPKITTIDKHVRAYSTFQRRIVSKNNFNIRIRSYIRRKIYFHIFVHATTQSTQTNQGKQYKPNLFPSFFCFKKAFHCIKLFVKQ